MNRIAEMLPTFLLNAAWQVAAVALVATACARLLRDAPARLRHGLWVAALLISVALPLLSVYDTSTTPSTPEAAPAIRVERAPETRAAAASTPPAVNTGVPTVTVSAGDDANSFPLARSLRRRRQTLTGAPALPLALAACYLLFLLFRVAALWRAWRRTQGLRRSARALEISSRLGAVAESCRAAFGLRRIEIRCSSEASAPAALGARAPLIILPASLFDGATTETLASVVGHEAAHVARRDFALNLAYEFILLPISFHPLARLIKRQIDRTRELACDEMVAERVVAPDTYARSLVRVAGALVSHADRAFTLGVFDADILEERIMRLTRNTRRTDARAARLLALAALSTLCLSCLAISTFSFELRARVSPGGDAPRAHARDAASERAPRDVPQGRRDEPPAREERGSAVARRGEIAQMLASDSPERRAQGACAAGHERAVDLIPALASMLGDDAAVQLSRCWEDGNWSPALDSFKQPSPGEQAAIALASMGKPALARLTVALDEGNASERRNAAWAIGELTNMRGGERAEAVPRLVSLLADSDEWVRMAAARALGEIRDERALDKLIATLGDGEWRVRQLTAWALSELKDERAVDALCRVLAADAQADVRQTAAMALGEIQNRRALAPLKEALNDPEPRVRAKAQWAISEIEDSDG
ncbi:MAG TPA: M56 family metallopeptidase [Pyrinomonadaceae bacterium]|jgi:HEAT repeat protein/beta-lactamase regulating signal transducer with metallopeptidase domain|nr:M56 family metallopeptidase [Pyrinomonadaceae bacterium]